MYIRILSALPYQESEVVLLAALGDPAVDVRYMAIDALGLLGRPFVAARLQRGLASPEPRIAASTALAMGRLKHAPCIPDLIALLTSPNPEVAANELWSLRQISGQQFPADKERWSLWKSKSSGFASEIPFPRLVRNSP
jgi:HEAT repeat protein